MEVVSTVRPPLVTGGKTASDVTNDLAIGLYATIVLLWEGIGVWGLNKTVGWAWDITNFVWWVGIGHAGTLISAILLLFRQKWRMSINRAAEAMTIFAVLCAMMLAFIWAGYGLVFTGRCLYPIHLDPYGLILIPLYFGMCLRSVPILQFQQYSGISD
jgi:molybdopterin-containing oxidoreductase family membrane subunit